MIVCPTCGKENQDHYKFCLGCGSDLPRGAVAEEKRYSTPTPPAGIPAVSPEPIPVAPQPAGGPKMAAAPAAAPAPKPAAAPAPKPAAPAPKPAAPAPAPAAPAPAPGGGIQCPNCGTMIPPGFAFCGGCGTPVPGAEPPVHAVAAFAPDSARLVLINPDGTEGGQVEIPTTEVSVGRAAGGFFETDPYLSPIHASFRSTGKEVIAKDSNSLNGIFLKVKPNVAVEIRSGDIFRIGQELILFEAIDRGAAAPDGTEKMGSPIAGLWGRIALVVGRKRLGNAFPIGGDGVVLGRERGNVLFPEDGYVSGLHMRLYQDKNKFFIMDLGSSNGTFLKIRGEVRVKAGDFLLMGQQLFRVDL